MVSAAVPDRSRRAHNGDVALLQVDVLPAEPEGLTEPEPEFEEGGVERAEAVLPGGGQQSLRLIETERPLLRLGHPDAVDKRGNVSRNLALPFGMPQGPAQDCPDEPYGVRRKPCIVLTPKQFLDVLGTQPGETLLADRRDEMAPGDAGVVLGSGGSHRQRKHVRDPVLEVRFDGEPFGRRRQSGRHGLLDGAHLGQRFLLRCAVHELPLPAAVHPAQVDDTDPPAILPLDQRSLAARPPTHGCLPFRRPTSPVAA